MENNALNLSKTLPICKETLAKILRVAIVDKRLTELSLRVLTYICLYCDDISVTNDDICQKVGISHRETIAKIWKNLLDTNWIIRTPKINPKIGKTIKGYLYRVPSTNLTTTNQVLKPRQNRAQCSNAHDTKVCNSTEQQNADKTTLDDVLSDSTHKNKDILINKSNLFLNNTPLTPQEDSTSLDLIVKTIAKRVSPNISDIDIEIINKWSHLISTKSKKPFSQVEIEMVIERLADYHKEGVDIKKLVVDSVEYRGNFLLTPNISTPKYPIKVKNTQIKRAYMFDNQQYFRPENAHEKNKLSKMIADWYAENINPKNLQKMTPSEIEVINKHKDICFRTNGICTSNWYAYINANEINSFTSLIDQPPSLELASNTLEKSKGFHELSAVWNNRKQRQNKLEIKTL